ncbi:MAG TPA: alpha/beta fold hydrolase [Actinomycetota bacterium]|nr:alpha/beta fold hydrolase [Actinomycetota bacterium]
MGEGVPILLIHPAGSTASTWGYATEELARIGRVITYDRRGYARSGGQPAHSMSTHTADAAAILESLRAPPAVVVGTSAGAAIAVDLAVRRPDLVQAVIAHEFPWRFTRHLPTASQVAALARIGSLALRGRQSDAAEALLRSAYSYRDGGTAWDAFPEEWRRVARDNARAALTDFRNSIGVYPSRTELATVHVPVVCSYGARSPTSMFRLVRSLAAAIPDARTHRIEGAGHAAPFDATTNFVRLVADTIGKEQKMSAYSELLDYYVERYNAGDLDAVMELYAEDAVQIMPDGIFEGRDAIRARLAQDLVAVPDAVHTVRSFVEQGDAFADEWTFAGTQTGPFLLPDGTELPPTGKRVEVKGMEFVQMRDGKIVVDNLYYDYLGIAAQLGLLPQAATA